MSIRRMLPFIAINVIVSAVVVLVILYWWDSRRPDTAETLLVPTVTTTAPPVVATAAAIAQNTDTPAPSQDEPLVHVVKAGDTLGNISRSYDVPMEDIVAANDIVDPNTLAVGQQLVIPVGGLPTDTPAPTDTPPPATPPTPLSTEPPQQGELVVEIANVIGIAQLSEEAVQILNSGSSQIALLDWQLHDEDGFIYTFGQVTLFGSGSAIMVHTETGQDGATDLFWGLEESVWQPGELVTLRDAEGEVQATYQIPEESS